MTNSYVFTSESVSEGHPDKVADQISDAILDALLAKDKTSRVACEALVKNENIILAGEITSSAAINYEQIIKEILKEIGYTDPALGFSDSTCKIMQFINQQSPDISMGVDSSDQKEQGAGDQGLMFGFACNETPELMPLPISLSHKLAFELSRVRKEGGVDFLKPDSKTQASVRYNGNTPLAVDTIVVSTQHSADKSLTELEGFITENVIKKVIPSKLLKADTKIFVNPTGRFVIGGPVGDCGLTGRKIIVDTYGGYGRHGGGAFSGKDPSKVDRSGAYAARHIAKNIVAAGIAERCEVQIAYAIGVAEPVSVFVNTFGTAKIEDAKISAAVRKIFSLTPRGIIESLDLLRPIYKKTATYGHFGRTPTKDGCFTWERTDKVEQLRDLFPKELLLNNEATVVATSRCCCCNG